MSPEMIQRRAAAVRERWTDSERQLRSAGDDGRHRPPLPKPKPVLSQAQRVRLHIEAGNIYGALKIAAAWRKLGTDREAVTLAWAAYQRGDRDGPEVLAGIEALRRRLRVG